MSTYWWRRRTATEEEATAATRQESLPPPCRVFGQRSSCGGRPRRRDPRRLAVRRAHIRGRAAGGRGLRGRGRLPARGPRHGRRRLRRGRAPCRPGGAALDPEVVAQLLGRRGASPVDDLSPREREVLALMAEGRSNAGIDRRARPHGGRRREATSRASSTSFASRRRTATTGASSPSSPTSRRADAEQERPGPDLTSLREGPRHRSRDGCLRVRDRPRKRRAPPGGMPRVVAHAAAGAGGAPFAHDLRRGGGADRGARPGCRRPGGVVRRRRRPHRALRRAGARRRARRGRRPPASSASSTRRRA